MTVKQKFRIHSQKQLSQIRSLEIINSYHSSSSYPAEIISCIKKSAEYFRRKGKGLLKTSGRIWLHSWESISCKKSFQTKLTLILLPPCRILTFLGTTECLKKAAEHKSKNPTNKKTLKQLSPKTGRENSKKRWGRNQTDQDIKWWGKVLL